MLSLLFLHVLAHVCEEETAVCVHVHICVCEEETAVCCDMCACMIVCCITIFLCCIERFFKETQPKDTAHF